MKTMHVLIPLDGSPWSRQIVAEVPQLFDPAHTCITLLRVADNPQGVVAAPRTVSVDQLIIHTYESPYEAEIATHPIYASQVRDSRHAELETDLLPDVRQLEQAGFRACMMVRFGDPAAEIIDAAEREGVDLIAMATHGRAGLRRLVMGSVAAEVLQRGRVPVIMVRPVARSVERTRTRERPTIVAAE